MDCDCNKWARESLEVFTKHHPECTEYDPEGEAAEVINNLLDGIIAWAADEDGVHPDCWNAFERAAHFVMRSEIADSDNEAA